MCMFKKKFKKWNSILTFLSLLCKFEENLSTKVALVTNGQILVNAWTKNMANFVGTKEIKKFQKSFIDCLLTSLPNEPYGNKKLNIF